MQAACFVGESVRQACVVSDLDQEARDDAACAEHEVYSQKDPYLWKNRLDLVDTKAQSPCESAALRPADIVSSDKQAASQPSDTTSTCEPDFPVPAPMPLRHAILLVLTTDGMDTILAAESCRVRWRHQSTQPALDENEDDSSQPQQHMVDSAASAYALKHELNDTRPPTRGAGLDCTAKRVEKGAQPCDSDDR